MQFNFRQLGWANKILFVVLFFVVVLAIFFSKPLKDNLALVPAETIYHVDTLYQPFADQVKNLPSNGLLSDLVYQMYPWRHFLGQSLKAGFLPLWNPYSLAGLPFLANDQSSVFELTKLLSYLLDVGVKDFMLFSSFITLFLAGFFSYLFLRNLKLRQLAALVGGSAFMFCGPVIVWLGYPLTSVMVWLPLVLWSVDKLVAKSTKLGLGVLALAIAAQFFAGNPETSWFVLITAAAYVLFRLVQQWRKLKKPQVFYKKTAFLVLALVLGLALASVQILPTFEFIYQSEAWQIGRGGQAGTGFFDAVFFGQWNSWQSQKDFKNSFFELPLLIYPDYFGNPTDQHYWGPSNYNESSLHVGLIPLVLALLALGYLRGKNEKRGAVLFWAITVLVTQAIFFDWPIFRLVGYLPIFKVVAIGRLRFIFAFALACLAAFGTHWLLDQKNKTDKKAKLAYFIIVFFALAAYLRHRFIIDGFDLVLRQQVKIFIFFLFAATLFALILILFARRQFAKKLGMILLLALVVLELFYYSFDYHPAIAKELVFPKTKEISFLQENLGHYRLTSYHENEVSPYSAMQPNSSLLWGLADIRGYEIIRNFRYDSFERHFARADSWLSYKLYDQRVFDVLGVKYFVQAAEDEENKLLEQQPSLKEIYNNGKIKMYQNLGVLPRAFVVFNIHPIRDFFVAKDVFFMETWRPDMTAIVETENPDFLTAAYQNNPTRSFTEAEIISYQPNQVIVATATEQDGYLVLTDVYDKNWQALLDGQKQKIYPTNVAFRGLFVPAGRHQIIFKYKPKTFIVGGYLSFIALVICLGLIVLGLWEKTKKSSSF
jgi:hypothetical protein